MALNRTCDSCGATITEQPTQLTLPSDGTMAGAQIDLCPACADKVIKDTKVTKARDNFVKKMKRQTETQG